MINEMDDINMIAYVKRLYATVLLVFLLFTAGCQTTYYAVWEKMGKEKRHLLKDNVEKAREEQAEACDLTIAIPIS